jgi:hypothetical protein
MNQEERVWINQNIFYHKDLQFNTGNSLDLSFSSSTQDFQTYSPPSLNLSISSGSTRKVFTINYQTAIDLTRAFKQGVESNFSNFNVYRKHGDRALKVDVHQMQDTKEWVSSINVVYSSSDSSLIVLPMSVFFSLICLIKDFSTYYLNLTFDFSTRTLVTELLKETKEIKSSIKALPSFLKEVPRSGSFTTEDYHPLLHLNPVKEGPTGSLGPDPCPSGTPGPESLDSTLTDEFSSFIDQNIDKIDIPELGKAEIKQEVVQEYDSPFIKRVLKGDISTFENLFNSVSVKMDSSILTFKDILSKNMGLENIDYLPGISKDELKSVLYMTKILYRKTLFSFANNNAKIPQTVSLVKYQVDPKLIQPVNSDLAYDLLMISGYLRLLKNQLEKKIVNQVESKSFLYMTFRCFTDVFTFSFLDDKDEATIKNCVVSRFKWHQKAGLFKKYEFILESCNCKQITETDIGIFIDEVTSKVVRRSPFIKQVHEKSYAEGELAIPFENDFSVEQIINEAVYLEIAKRVGVDINNEADLSRVVDPFTISDKVKDMFRNPTPKSTKKKETTIEEKETNLVRFVNFYKNDVPERFRDKFLAYIKELKYGPCVLDNQDFPLEELGEDIVKGLYVWQETEDRAKDKYTDFYLRFETCLLDKKLIISKTRGAKKEEVPAENWLSASEIE